MDGQTDGWTTVKQYAPDLSMWGHEKLQKQIHTFSFYFCLMSNLSTLTSILNIINEPCSVEKGINASVKSTCIDPCQSVQLARADLVKTF